MAQTVLITGASRGIGLAMAKEFTACGDRVFAACRDISRATELEKLAQSQQGQVVLVQLDVTSDESARLAAEKVAKDSPSLDILINNAARGDVPDGTLEGLDMPAMLALLNTNTVGPLRVTKAFFSLLKREQCGKAGLAKVVNISSDLACISGLKSCNSLAYGTSKAGLNHLTRSLAFDLQRYGIIVAAISPGWVRTDMGGKNAPLSPEESASGIARVIQRLTVADSSRWFNHDGTECTAW